MEVRVSPEKISEQVLHLLEQQGFAAAGTLKQQLGELGILVGEDTHEEQLMRNALAFHGQQIAGWRQDIRQDSSLTTEQKILKRYELLSEHVQRGRFPGCLFIAACSAFPAPHHPIHQEAEKQKQASWQYTHQYLLSLETDNPTMVTDQLELILEGCLSKLLVKRNLQDIAIARRLAEDILQVALCRKNGALG
ncbi:TetR family transcriptional regulator [Tatumella ptyseos ATCC 33301]|uniref:TetR family transcriptional regulator n=1 Tax=Tatumella ptyseos ATCC 33301 TaxID=1005995 RepID=A0A085JKR2_9GAMM|nr:TetR family transcriptional regulator [Tatumella ptyseos ATCC 33301]